MHKSINIIGHGITTKAIIKLLNALDYICNIFCESKNMPNTENARNDKNTTLDSKNTFYNLESLNEAQNTLAIISPGIFPNKAYLAHFKNIISEYDFIYFMILALKYNHEKLNNLQSLNLNDIKNTINKYKKNNDIYSIWITGTNGKTSATEMMQYMLSDFKNGGNIGIPLAQLLLQELGLINENLDCKNAQISQDFLRQISQNFKHKKIKWILETSSFSLHYAKYATPNAYIVLNIKDDHLDWHHGFENYKCAKLDVLNRMDENSCAIIANDFKDEKSVKNYKGNIFLCKDTKQIAEHFSLDEKLLNLFYEPFRFNLAIDLALIKMANINNNIENIRNYKIGDYRIQKIDSSFIYAKKNETQNESCKNQNEAQKNSQNDIMFINDSKATNPFATFAALETFKDNDIFLILGGDNKGIDLSELLNFIKSQNNIYVFGIGACKNHIQEGLKDFNKYKICKNMKDALQNIKIQVKNNNYKGIVMLSPACSSLDEYSSYKQRGDEFNALIKEIFKDIYE